MDKANEEPMAKTVRYPLIGVAEPKIGRMIKVITTKEISGKNRINQAAVSGIN